MRHGRRDLFTACSSMRSYMQLRAVWANADRLGGAIRERKREGVEMPESLLRHITPLGWEHILPTGEYRWPRMLHPIA